MSSVILNVNITLLLLLSMAEIDNSKRLRKEPKMQHFIWFIHVKIHVCLYYNEKFDENTAIFVLIYRFYLN